MAHFRFKPKPEMASKLQRALEVDEVIMSGIGMFVIQQIKDRFRTAGASGGVRWPEKKVKDWGYDDGRAILTGRTARLMNSFVYTVEGNRVTIYTEVPYAHVHQLGTQKYGGPIPTIRAKNGKALFIPITDKAQAAQPLFVFQNNKIRKVVQTAMRILTGSPLRRGNSSLVKGRIKNNRLEKWSAREGKYVPGTPDFIFLAKVDIPKREMLPDSNKEQEELKQYIEVEIPDAIARLFG